MLKLLVSLLALVAALALAAPVDLVTAAAPATKLVVGHQTAPIDYDDVSAGKKAVGGRRRRGGDASWSETDNGDVKETGAPPTSEPVDDETEAVQSSPAEPAKLPAEVSDEPSTAEPSSVQPETDNVDDVTTSTVVPTEAADEPSSAEPGAEDDVTTEPADKPSSVESSPAETTVAAPTEASDESSSAEKPSGESPAPHKPNNDTFAVHEHGKIPATLNGGASSAVPPGVLGAGVNDDSNDDDDVSTTAAVPLDDVTTSDVTTTTTVDAVVENSTTTSAVSGKATNSTTAATNVKPADQKDEPRNSSTSFTLGLAALAVLRAAVF